MQTFLFNPLFWVFLVVSVAMFSKKKRWKIISLFFFLLLTSEWVSYNLLFFWEENTVLKGKEITAFDIGLVLGPFIQVNGEAFSEENPNCQPINRFQEAIALYEQGKFKKFLLTGDDDIEQAKAYLLHICVSPSDILVEGKSQNTYENALFSKQLLVKKGYTHKNILLITSAYHMRRAKKCFQKVGLRILPYSVDYYSFTENYLGLKLKYVVPSDHGVVYWRILFREWMSMFVFWVYGYI